MEYVLMVVSALGGAVLGAVLGGRAAAAAAVRQTARDHACREARTLINLFQALEAELSQVWEHYHQLVGRDLEQADELETIPLAGLFATSSRPFPVFDSSARLLGALDPASGRELISTFLHFKAFMEEWQALVGFADRQRQARLKANVNLYEARCLREEAERLFAYLKQRHFQVKGLVAGSLERLREFLRLALQSQGAVTIKL